MKQGKPRISLSLEPGQYMVDAHASRLRVWKHQGNGEFVGHGVKIRRTAVANTIGELNSATDDQEGTGHHRTYQGRLLGLDGAFIREVGYSLNSGFGELSPALPGDDAAAFLLEFKGGDRVRIDGRKLNELFEKVLSNVRGESTRHYSTELSFKIDWGSLQRRLTSLANDTPF